MAGDFGGVLKKEVPLAGLVLSIPYQNRAASRLYFPFVGDNLAVRPVSRRVAVERILNDIAPAHRFDGPADQWDLMQLVTDFVTPLACADLELSTTLLHIESLMDVLDCERSVRPHSGLANDAVGVRIDQPPVVDRARAAARRLAGR